MCVQKQQAGQRSPGKSRNEAAAPALLGEALSDQEIRRKNFAAVKLQARGKGMIERKIVQGKKAAGELPGQNRLLAQLKEIPTSTKSTSGEDEMVLSIPLPSGSLSILSILCFSLSVCLHTLTSPIFLARSFSLPLPLSLSTRVFWKIYLYLKTWLLSKKQTVSTKKDWMPGEKTPLDNPLTNLRVSTYASGENLVLCSFSSGPTRANQSCGCVSHMSVLPPPLFYMGCPS
jgi:hypothetical protein